MLYKKHFHALKYMLDNTIEHGEKAQEKFPCYFFVNCML